MTRRKSVLIVEDDLPLRQLYRIALTLAGFSVREVGDGYDALHAIDVEPPDLVVLDLALPRLNGHAVRQELAGQAHTRQIPVVIVTGTSGPEIQQLHADRVMTKPIAADTLVDVVKRCLARPPVKESTPPT
jgi:twitching motility two-component system response regulator PilH